MKSESPHGFIWRTVYIPIESVASFSSCLHLALTACRALDLSHIHSPMHKWDIFFFKRLPWIIQPEMIVVLYPAESSRKYSLTCLRNALRFSLILIRRINAKCISRLQCTPWDGKSLSTKSRFHQENYSRGWGSFPHPPTQSELSQTILILKLSVASYGKKKKSYLGKYHSKALVNLY